MLREMQEVTELLNNHGCAVGNEHRRYAFLERVRNLIRVKNYAWRKLDESRADKGLFERLASLLEKWKREMRMPSVEEAIEKYPRELLPPDRNEILAWLGQWRDKMPPQAVVDLQNIIGVPK